MSVLSGQLSRRMLFRPSQRRHARFLVLPMSRLPQCSGHFESFRLQGGELVTQHTIQSDGIRYVVEGVSILTTVDDIFSLFENCSQ